MSPEIAQRYLDAKPNDNDTQSSCSIDYQKVDVYSYGIVLWCLVTRDFPFKRLKRHPEKPQAIAEEVLAGFWTSSSTRADGSILQKIMSMCWDEDPGVRPTFLEIVVRQ